MTRIHSFGPQHRLRAGADFDRLYRQGRRSGDNFFSINALANTEGCPRLGMSVSYRSVGKAVRRNYIRRLIREVFRHAHANLPAVDYVVTSRPGARNAPGADLTRSLERLLVEVTRRTQPPKAAP